jgi:hypothetical protein
MQATRGFAVSVRSRGRLIGSLAALAVLVTVFLAPSSAGATTFPVKEQYLALGDSLAFGYSLQLYHEGEAVGFEDPEMFEHGYANDLLKVLKGKATKLESNVKLVNDGCPGETTDSLIGSNASLIATLNAALKTTQTKNGLPPVTGEAACAYQAAWNGLKKVGVGGPLHHPYSGSQLEDAIATIANATNIEHKPVTTVTLNIGANDELHSLGKVEAEAKAFVESKPAAKAKEFVEGKVTAAATKFVVEKVEKVGAEAVEAKLKPVAEAAIGAKLHKVAEEAIGAKLHKVAEEAIEAKVGEQVFIKCSEKAFAENGGSFEEPGFAEHREACLASEGKKLGEEYFAEHATELTKEGEEAAGAYFAAHEAQLIKEGEEAAGAYFVAHEAELLKEGKEAAEKYFGEHKAELEKGGKEAAEKYAFENKAKLEEEGKKFGEEYFFIHKAELEKEGKEFGEKYFVEHAYELVTEGEVKGSELIAAAVPGLFKHIVSNISGILVAVREGGTLGLDGGKAINYTGRIIFMGGYNPFGKLFSLAKEAVEFVETHGGPSGSYPLKFIEEKSGAVSAPFGAIQGRCSSHGLTLIAEAEHIAAGCLAGPVQPVNGLVEALNTSEYETVHGGFASCMSFPKKEFNTGNSTTESEHLKLWLNMTNGSQTKVGVTLKYNGPDIHPTPAGYAQLSKELAKEMNGKCHHEGLPGF